MITEAARARLEPLLAAHPGTGLRLIHQGYG